MKLVVLLICISFQTLQLQSYGNSPVFCQQHFALQLPSFSQRVLRRGYPSQAHSTNQFCFLAFHQRKNSTFNICYTCPSSLNCGIHEFLNRLCVSLSRNNQREQTAPQSTNYSINFSTPQHKYQATAFVSRLENTWWDCGRNQRSLNGN